MAKDATLRKWFLKFTNETGETPTHIIFGLDRWDDYEGQTWEELKLNELIAWDEVPDSALDREFDSGYGGNNSPNLCAWSESWVISSDNYDGAEALFWLPRHPTTHDPKRPGGG